MAARKSRGTEPPRQGIMRLLDSNIIIYASKPDYAFLEPLIGATDICASAISYVEVLGYHLLSQAETDQLDEFFANTSILPLSPSVLDEAVKLRRQRKMKLGDALVAGTALYHKCSLVTRNVKDFDGIPNLTVYDPFPAAATP
jgi:predicted nucleic acid-binding protein